MRETHIDPGTNEIQKIVEYTLGHDQISQTTIVYTSGVPGTPETVIFAADGHGSVRLLLNMAGAIATVAGMRQLFHYDAYGNAIGSPCGRADHDRLLGFGYNRDRYLDYATGRFIGLDRYAGNLQDPQSLHKYLYTHGDPINGIDPTGQFISAVESLVVSVNRSVRCEGGSVGFGVEVDRCGFPVF